MTLTPSDQTPLQPPERQPSAFRRVVSGGAIALAALVVMHRVMNWDGRSLFLPDPWYGSLPAPLVMEGGDPYIRALMRTISASESNDPEPYNLIYGGDRFQDFGQHPDACVPIVAGPNVGDCTTAAGRYQFITTTWLNQASKYHPNPDGFWMWQDYNFAPEYQDRVVHAWLSDPEAWGANLSELLQEGQLETVLQILSPTWTSLGYGIETNSMTGALPQIYGEVLQEELAIAQDEP